jgi:hypothetical protein
VKVGLPRDEAFAEALRGKRKKARSTMTHNDANSRIIMPGDL